MTLAAFELLVPFRTTRLTRPLAADDDRVALGVDADILTAHARQLDRQDIAIGLLDQVNRRNPPGCGPSEQTLEALLHGEQVARRIPRHSPTILRVKGKGQRAKGKGRAK